MESPKTNIESEVVSEYPAFLVGGTEFRYVRFDAPDNVIAWRQYIKSGEHFERIGILKIERIQTDSLKALGIWSQLGKEAQDGLLKAEDGGVVEKMEHARKYRRNKYPGIPRSILCINCGEEKAMSPGLIVKGAEKIAKEKGIIYTAEDFIKNFKCSKCFPKHRGRKPTHNLPPKVTLTCKCGNEVTYPASVVAKTIEKKGITLDQYVGEYVCRKCNPFKGRAKNHNLPPKVELVCIRKCGKKIVYPASVVAKTLVKKGITLKQYVENFVCQNCENTRGRPKKSK